MKNLRILCAALVLTGALTFPAFAGEIGTGVAPPPTQNATGEIGTGVTAGNLGTAVASEEAEEATTADSVTEAAFLLLQSVLALF